MSIEYSAVIVAAGLGTRMNLGYNKVYYEIDGHPILETTMDIFLKDDDCKQVVVVTNSDDYHKSIAEGTTGKVVLAKGGATRQESVSNGLEAVICDVVFIHDGARPYLAKESLAALKEAMETEQAVCLMVPCKDTIKRVEGDYIVETIDRNVLRAAQTPQCFKTDLIRTCMEKAWEENFIGTDDSMLVEKYSDVKVRVVEGTFENKKITTPEDLK